MKSVSKTKKVILLFITLSCSTAIELYGSDSNENLSESDLRAKHMQSIQQTLEELEVLPTPDYSDLLNLPLNIAEHIRNTLKSIRQNNFTSDNLEMIAASCKNLLETYIEIAQKSDEYERTQKTKDLLRLLDQLNKGLSIKQQEHEPMPTLTKAISSLPKGKEEDKSHRIQKVKINPDILESIKSMESIPSPASSNDHTNDTEEKQNPAIQMLEIFNYLCELISKFIIQMSRILTTGRL